MNLILSFDILNSIPTSIIYDNNDEPPYEINGKVIPIIGSKPIVIPIFCICWKSNTAIIPPTDSLSLIFGVFDDSDMIFKSKYIISPIRRKEPINPKFDAYTANIKSVCISGKYIGVLLNPCPNIPADPMAVNPFVNCSPLELDQFSILSIR